MRTTAPLVSLISIIAACGGDIVVLGIGDPDSGGAGGHAETASSSPAGSAASSSASSSSSGGGLPAPCEGQGRVLAALPTLSGPFDIEVDETSVYWSCTTSGEIMSVAKGGAASAVVLASAQPDPWGIDLHGGDVYWVGYSIDGVLRRVPKAGGSVVDVVIAPVSRYLSVLGTLAWWTREPDDLQRVDIDGSNEFLMLSANVLPNEIEVDDTGVYWVNIGDGRVRRSDFDGQNAQDLATDQDAPWGIAIDEAYVYWTNSGDGTIRRIDKLGAASATFLASTSPGLRGIAVDATHVYWVNADDGTVGKAPKSGGPVTVLCAGQAAPSHIAVDDASVYWTNSGDDTVVAAPK